MCMDLKVKFADVLMATNGLNIYDTSALLLAITGHLFLVRKIHLAAHKRLRLNAVENN